MLTITTTTDILLQVHRNHVVAPLPTSVTVSITGFNGGTLETTAAVQELANCYLISVPLLPELVTLGINADLTISGDQGVLYKSDLQLFLNETND